MCYYVGVRFGKCACVYACVCVRVLMWVRDRESMCVYTCVWGGCVMCISNRPIIML